MINLLPHASPCSDPDIAEEFRPLATILISLEARHHEQGWDELPVMLYMISQIDDDGLEMLTANGIQLGKVMHPREELKAMALSMTKIAEMELSLDRERLENFKELYEEGTRGHAFIMESWVCVPGETTDDEEALNSNRSLADIPGSLEARFAVMTTGDQLMFVSRVRDEEPEFSCIEPGTDASVVVGGEMIDALVAYDNAVKALSKKLKEVKA